MVEFFKLRDDAKKAARILRPDPASTHDFHLNKRLALTGKCGACDNLKLRFNKNGGVATVACMLRHDIEGMYAGVSLGKQPNCMDFTPEEGKKSK